MADPPLDSVPDLLRAIGGDLAEVKADLTEVRDRLGHPEERYASLSRRVDRLGGDVQQVKRRLPFVEA